MIRTTGIKKMKRRILTGVLLTLFSLNLYAAPEAPASAATCVACHGPDGNSPLDLYPKIAGQHATYLTKQLKEFKLGLMSGGKEGRIDPVMGGMAMPLTDEDMVLLGKYFAKQSLKYGQASEASVDTAETLYRGGDMARGLPACIACHGPKGNGTELSGFPRISGQHPAYTKAQLEKFRAKTRNNDLNAMMQDVAAKLTDEEIQALSDYLAGLH